MGTRLEGTAVLREEAQPARGLAAPGRRGQRVPVLEHVAVEGPVVGDGVRAGRAAVDHQGPWRGCHGSLRPHANPPNTEELDMRSALNAWVVQACMQALQAAREWAVRCGAAPHLAQRQGGREDGAADEVAGDDVIHAVGVVAAEMHHACALHATCRS